MERPRRRLQSGDVPTASRMLDLLAALSHGANLSIGCYCENEARCPLPPVCASQTTDGPWREPRVDVAATAEALVADGQDSVPHERCR